MQKIYELFQSTITRIVLVIIVIIAPLNILTIVMSCTIVNNNRQQIYNEMEGNLQNSAARMEELLASANKRMISLSFNNQDFRMMEFPPKHLSRLELSGAFYNAKTELKRARQEYQMVDGMFFYFRKRGYVMIDGVVGVSNQSMHQYIAQIVEKEKLIGTEWTLTEIEEEIILFSHSRWNHADYGVLVNVDWALERLELTALGEGRIVFFADENNTVISSSGTEYLQEIGMTLEQIKQSKNYKVIQAPVTKHGIVLVEVLEVNKVLTSLPVAVLLLELITIILTLLAIPLLLFYIYNWVNLPLRRLTRAMDQIENGNLDFRIKEHERGREFEQINRNFNAMMEQVNELKIKTYEKELEKKDIHMRYLSQQVQPHFILNAMNILYSYEPEEYPLIQKMVLCLSKYFRYIVRVNSEFVELEKEMEHIKNYFEIQRVRYPENFFSIVEYEEGIKKALIPPLLIQNFAENAIKYSLRAGNKITIFVIAEYLKGDGKSNRMRIRIADTGEGISDEILAQIEIYKQNGKTQEGLGVGIQNSIDRLMYLYDSKDTEIRFMRNETYGGTTVEIILPCVIE